MSFYFFDLLPICFFLEFNQAACVVGSYMVTNSKESEAGWWIGGSCWIVFKMLVAACKYNF